MNRRRLSDGHPVLARLERLWQNVVPLIALGLALWAVLGVQSRAEEVANLAVQNARVIREQAREARIRRDQSCTQDERRHLDDVTRLKRTYAFLSHLPTSEYGTSLTVAIVRQLPEVENEARHDVAPPFCDEPGIGLPEPDPRLPERRDFSRLLHQP